jgi:ketosteroid isomerase-like protein
MAQLVVDTWRDDYNGGNFEGVAALYEPDAYYLTQHFATGVVHGRESIKAYVKRGVDAGYKINSLFILTVGCSGEMMYVVTRYDATNAGQKVFGVNLVVLKQEGTRWLIAAHEAAVPDPATAIQDLNIPASGAQGVATQ